MTAKQLTDSILQMAIEGKLVPQDPNDEPASVLLENIREEKRRLVQEGKLKKKDLEETPISEDERPFEIPESWEWCRLGEISTYSHTKKKINASKAAPNIWGLDLEDIEKGGKLLCIKSVGERKAIGDKTCFEEGDILYSKLRPYLLKILIAPQNGICTPEIIPFTCYGNISKGYIVNLLKSVYVDRYINSATFGIKMPRVATETMTSLIIPLPPLAEQKRIVAKIEELLPVVKEYGEAYKEASKMNAGLPDKLKKSVLQDAIMGKLGTQDENDEPVSVLLEKIREEKRRLVQEGVLKKKDLEETPISEDEKPFEIPDNWGIAKLSLITSLIDGEKIEGDYVCLDAKFLRGKSTGDILSKGKYVKQGDNIILVDGENSGEVFTVPCDGYMGSTFKQLWVSEEVFLPYVLFFIKYYKDILRNSKKGAAIPHLNKEIFYNLIIGIPPLAEQRRIVEKIEALFVEIDNIKIQ